MATFAIGDVQGCYSSLRRLLDKCRFDPARDRLWLVGDLVNRGPHSLAVLRFVKGLGARAITILGNHDLHLLVVAAGHVKPHHGDTLAAILRASDRDELLDWLRHRKMMHAGAGYAMVHAGCCRSGRFRKRSRSRAKSRPRCKAMVVTNFCAICTATGPIAGATI